MTKNHRQRTARMSQSLERDQQQGTGTQSIASAPAGEKEAAVAKWRWRDSHGNAFETVAQPSEAGEAPDTLAWALSNRGVYIPSAAQVYTALVAPILLWLVVVASGMLQFKGLPENKRSVKHVLTWFDVRVFRTYMGPTLPFFLLTLRCLPSLDITLSGSTEQLNSSSRGKQGRAASGRPTLMPQVIGVYLFITLLRMALYALHWELQRRDRLSSPGQAAVAYLSDHILLGAAVLACVQQQHQPASHWRQAVYCAVLVMSAVLLVVLSVDMHYTARYFHYPAESGVALMGGLLFFQAPMVVLLHWSWRHRQEI